MEDAFYLERYFTDLDLYRIEATASRWVALVLRCGIGYFRLSTRSKYNTLLSTLAQLYYKA
jgi:hypothetical protein